MHRLLPLVLISLSCIACDSAGQRSATMKRDWFATYQTDRSCQYIHATHEDVFLKGPTGRTHPF